MKFSVVLPLAIAAALTASAQNQPAAPKPGSSPAKSRISPTPSSQAPAPPASAAPAAPAPVTPAPEPGAAPAAAPAVDPNKVVMTVGTETITAKEFDTLIEALPEQYRAQARGPMKRQMAEQIARVKVLAGEARRRGLDKDKTVQARIQFQSDNLLAGATYNDYLQKASVDEAALRKYYEEHSKEFESLQARHILVKFKGSPVPTREGKPELSEEQALAKAQELKKQLAAGGDFAALAKADSDDTGSGANGGDLGTFSRGQMVPAFEEAAFKLPVGQVSDPIKTQFGYHLIRVEKHDTRAFDAVRPELEQRLRPDAARQSVENLTKSSKIVLEESYFGPEVAAPAPPVPGPAGAVPPSAAVPAPAPAPVKN